ncbi:MAG TPA: MFS transporter, partial [Dehalococcoidia bacterium]|nr:MFS transporter [Dehalococcoidia bacterium]
IGLGLGAAGAGGIIDLAGYRAVYVVGIGLLCGGMALAAANWSTLQSRRTGRELVERPAV